MKSRLIGLNSWLSTHVRAEVGLLTAFVAALFCFNVFTATLCSITRDDETLFSDPGVNLYQGHGFTSSAWSGQDKSALWSGNLPLYSLALSQWLKLTGLGLTQVRAFSYFLASLAMFTFWVALKRLPWIKTPLGRLGFIGIAFLSSPLFSSYRIARYDSLQVFLTSLILLAWSLRPGWARQVFLFVLGFLVPISGFNAVAFIGLVALILLAWQRKPALWPSGAIIFGLGTGIVSILVFYYFTGVIQGFIATILWSRQFDGGGGAGLLKTKILRVLTAPLTDPGILSMMLILIIVLSQRSLCVWDRTVQRFALLGLLCSYVIVIGLELAVHYESYYHWMNQLVLVGFVCVVLERSYTGISVTRKAAIVLVLAFSFMMGVPKNIFMSWGFEEGKEYSSLQEFVSDHIHANDTVFVDYLGYFPVKEKNLQVYMPAYLNVMTPAQEQSVTALLVKNLNNGGYYARFGTTYSDWFSRNGVRWKLVAVMEPEPTQIRMWLERHFPAYLHRHDSRTSGYRMSIYRRADVPLQDE